MARKSGFSDSKRRKRNYRKVTTLLVVCEGQTECGYFQFLNRKLRASGVSIKTSHNRSDPKGIVEEAIKGNSGNSYKGIEEGRYDQVWAVFDWDGRTRQIEEAKKLAAANKIHIALSNPAFELWLLWHFKEYMVSSCDQKHVLRELTVVWPGYDKGTHNDFTQLPRDCYKRARERAVKARETHKRNDLVFPNDQPSSEVDLLIDCLINLWNEKNPQNSACCPILL